MFDVGSDRGGRPYAAWTAGSLQKTGGSIMSSVAVMLGALLVPLLALGTPARSAEPDWPDAITIATASPGGTYFAYGEGLAKILTRVLGIRVATRPTEGPSENIRLIEDGQAQIGFVTMGVAQQGWNGMGDWTQGKQYRAMRALFPMYDTPFHFIVMQDKGAHSSSELAGKRLGVGP